MSARYIGGGPDRRRLMQGSLAAAGSIAGLNLLGRSSAWADAGAVAPPPLPAPDPALGPAIDPAVAELADAYQTLADLKTRTDDAQRMTAPVTIGGKGPYQFLVDTGADRTILSRELARVLQLEPGPTVRILGVAGAIEVKTVRVPNLQVGDHKLSDLSAPLLPVADLDAAGLLGVDSLRDQRLLLDFKRSRMLIQGGRRLRDDPNEIVVKAKSRYGQLTLVDSWLYGERVFMILDSGAEASVGNTVLRNRIRRARLATGQADLLSVTGQRTSGDVAGLPTLRIGAFVVNNLSIVFADLPPFARWGLQDEPAMLLGVDLMRQFETVAVDYVRREVRFKLPLPA